MTISRYINHGSADPSYQGSRPDPRAYISLAVIVAPAGLRTGGDPPTGRDARAIVLDKSDLAMLLRDDVKVHVL